MTTPIDPTTQVQNVASSAVPVAAVPGVPVNGALPGTQSAEIQTVRTELLNTISDIEHTLRDELSRQLNSVVERLAPADTSAVASDPTPAKGTVPAAVKTGSNPLAAALDVLKHSGLHAGAGLALAAVSAFTAAVPLADRGSTTIGGLSFALGSLLVDWLKSH